MSKICTTRIDDGDGLKGEGGRGCPGRIKTHAYGEFSFD